MTDAELRIFIYDRLIGDGRAPTSSDIASHFHLTQSDALERLASLKVGKTVLVHPTTHEIWMAGPFSAAESAYGLTDGTRTWWANCAWDMFGVAVLVGRTLRATGACPDCGEKLTIDCDPDRPPTTADGVVHFLLPARHWYDDISFT